MLERYLLRYFLAVVDQGTFSRAAQSCRVSQPTLSVGIAKLEALMGTALLVRSNRSIRLTAAGSRLLVHARRIESEFNVAQIAVQERAGAPPLRFGVLSSIAGSELAAIVALTREAGERFELVPGSARELKVALARGRIDAALTVLADDDAHALQRPLRQEGYAVALPAVHPLSARDAIAAEEVGGEVMILRRHCEALAHISRHFTERGVRPHLGLRATNDERVLQMVGAGLGVTVMPASYRHPDVRLVRLSGFAVTRTLGLALSTRSEHLAEQPTGIVAASIRVMTAPRPAER